MPTRPASTVPAASLPPPCSAKTLELLDLLVPIEIVRQRNLGELRIRQAQEAWQPVADSAGTGKTQYTGGSALMYGGPTYMKEIAAAATAIAAGAYQPGGITIFGRHWCTTDHPECPTRRKEVA